MRCLFVCRPSFGHWLQLVPLARALVQDGHTVAFATALSTSSQLAALGFQTFRAGIDDWDPTTVATFPRRPADLPADKRLEWQIRNVYASIAAEKMVADLLPVAAEWRPDLIVRDAAEFGACLAAEYLGLPHATVQAGIYHDAIIQGAREPLTALRAKLGLAPDPTMEMLHRYLLLYGAPRSFFLPETPVPPTTHALKPLYFDNSDDEALPPWIGQLPDRPTVHFTLGTVANRNLWVFEQVIEGLGEAPLNVVVTVGRDNDPTAFDPLPDNVRVESYIPQSLLMPYCDLLVAHGGYSTILTALSQGLPLVLIPLGGDQPVNSRRCVDLGVAQLLDARTLSPAQVLRAAMDALTVPSYRLKAEAVAREIAALPGPEHGAQLLVRLADTREPQLAATA